MAKAIDVIRGLQVLVDIGAAAGVVEVDAGDEQIWAGPVDLESVDDTPAEQAAALTSAGWFWDDKVDSWSIFM